MTSSALCSQCGTAVDPGARFCQKCGSDVSGQQGGVATRQVNTLDLTQTSQRGLVDELREAVLGEYEVLGELGRGGMATVFLGHDIQLDRKVAIKVMSPSLLEGEGMVDRFKLEARTAASLSHPHIIPIYAVKQTHHLLFFVMKFVEGRPLDSIIEEIGPLPIAMVQTVLTKVGEALGYAHRNGVVHRDIKPANIMIDVEGMPVVTDFGIAKVADHQGLTMTGATIGTPTYMSPEQCNAKQITGASDQYSLGIVAYEMLIGKVPFDADSVMTIMYKHCHDEPPRIAEARADVPPNMAEAIHQMLAKEPEHRWGSLEAAVTKMGNVTLAFNDPVRTQMIDLAKAGEASTLLKRVSTPRSPTPIQAMPKTSAPASASTAVDTSMPATAPRQSAETGQPTGTGGSKKNWWVALAAVVVLGGAVVGYVAMQNGAEPAAVVAEPPVTPPPAPAVAAVQVSPPSVDLITGQQLQLTPTVTDSTGQRLDSTVTWESSNPAVVDVSPEGFITALAAGTADITARSGATSGDVAVNVSPPPRGEPAPPPVRVAQVVITNAPTAIEVGQRFELQSRVIDNRGSRMARTVRWSTSDAGVATVRGGVVVGASPGPVVITASVGGVRQTAPIQVRAASVASVVVEPASVGPLEIGQEVSLTVRAFDSRNNTVPNVTPMWRSTDPSVATATGDRVYAEGAGQARLIADVSGHLDTVMVSVSAPPEPEPIPVDQRELIRSVIAEYSAALASKDLNRVKSVFPRMSSERENQLRDSFDAIRDLEVTLTVERIDVNGDVATALVHSVWVLRTRDGRGDTLDSRLRISLQQGPNGWTIVRTQDA